MSRWAMHCCTYLSFVILGGGLLAQEPKPVSKTKMVTCEFQDGKQMSVRYPLGITVRRDKPRNGELWIPGGSPLVLFTQANLMLAGTTIPAGAYFMYLIPDKHNWTLVVNKNVTASAPYNRQQDLVRVPMELGSFGEPQPFSATLAHVAPTQCNVRIYFGKTGSWAEFTQR
jgi:hypothetical protein